MRNAPIVIDPGHGGVAPAGRSSPCGARGPGGLVEKEVVLDLARRVCSHLGSGAAVLTRGADQNLPLGARADVARRYGAPVFVSLHASSGNASIAETYVHARAGGDSHALAQALRAAICGYGSPGRGASRGELAVLTPERVGPGTAAALVELDYGPGAGGDPRLGDPRGRDGLARKIATGIQSYMQRKGAGLEAAPAADDDSAYDIDGPIPDVPGAPPPADTYPQAMEGPDYPGASQFLTAGPGHFRSPAAPRAIERVVIHITDGTTLDGATSWFRSPANNVSAHYVVGQDATVVQMVHDADIAHHAGSANADSIGIEHVALSPNGARQYNRAALYPTDAEYCASAALVTWLCDTYNVPMDRQHILGHSEADSRTTHADCPNSVWDWDYFMQLVTSRSSFPSSQMTSQQPRQGVAQGYGYRAGRGATARVQVGTLRPPQYDPANADDSAQALRMWQEDLNRWVAGVPLAAHAVYPHSAICKLGLDGSGWGTGFYIGGNKLLTAGHCVSGVTTMEIRPGQAGQMDPSRTFTVTNAFRLYPGYGPSSGTDIGVVLLPDGHPLTDERAFQIGTLDQCPSGGLVICGYASETEDIDTQNAQMSFRVDPWVQHLSSGGFDLDGSNGGVINVRSNIARGTSGSPTFYVDTSGVAQCVGVQVAGRYDGSNNLVAALDATKVAWINQQA